jgi:putative PIN family toxin of toxin-antitoxin system
LTEKPRVVFDCNVLLQAAARERSVAAKCLNLVETDLIQLFVSREVFAEVEDILNRPEIRAHFPDLSDGIVGAFLKRLKKLSVLVQYVPKKFSYPRDEDDEPYINLAVAARANFIISRDRDLLDLMTGHTDECKEFRQRFRSIRVVEPAEFLNLLEESYRV